MIINTAESFLAPADRVIRFRNKLRGLTRVMAITTIFFQLARVAAKTGMMLASMF